MNAPSTTVFDISDILIKLCAALAVICSTLVGALLATYSALRIKRYEQHMQHQKTRAAQRLNFYQPLLRFCYEMDRRLGHIIAALDSDWLSGNYLESIKQGRGFASDPTQKGYFILSTVYIFACFFGWAEAIKRSGDAIQPFAEKSAIRRWLSRRTSWLRVKIGIQRTAVFQFHTDISTLSKLFQYAELFDPYVKAKRLVKPKDAWQLHKQIQYSIGQQMLKTDAEGNLRCMTFREFLESYLADQQFRYWLTLLEHLVTDLSRFEGGKDLETQVGLKNDVRPLRLLAIRYWCRILMRTITKELYIDTPPPDEVLKGVSESLQKCIQAVQVDQLESYLIELGPIPQSQLR